MYLPLSEYLERTELPQSAVTAFLARPGRSTTYVIWEGDLRAEIDANLRRRYAVPFGAIPSTAEPDPTKVPRLVKGWLATLLDEKFQRAFREPGSQVEAGDVDITSAAARVRTAMTQAANPDTEPRPNPLKWNYLTSGLGEPWDVGSGIKELNGTFDMMGNAWEWTESPYYSGQYSPSSYRSTRGGSFYDAGDYYLESSRRGSYESDGELDLIGFRIASVPEPCSLVLLSLGGLALLRPKN